MTQYSPDIRCSVVIVNYERPEDTIECIRSVLKSEFSPIQILLVDNGSRDGSVDKIMQCFPKITVFSLPENRGFAGGYNQGISHALAMGASHIFLLNNDTIIEPSTIPVLFSTPWDVAVPKILYYHQPERIWAAGSRWRPFPPAIVMNGYKKKDGPSYNVPKMLKYATGCAFLAKRFVFERVGGFDLGFESYLEDYDFFYRVTTAGFKTGYVPTARVYHKESQTLGPKASNKWYYLGRNTVLFYRKEGRHPAWMLWSVIGWFIIRETINGNIGLLTHFMRGMKQGYQLISLKKDIPGG